MSRYSDSTIANANEEYSELDEAMSTLRCVIDDLHLYDSELALKAALQELVDEAQSRLDELADIIDEGEREDEDSMESDYWRSVL